MPRYLLDTNVVCEAGRKRPDPGVVAFLERESDLCVSAILFDEMAFGVERAPADQRLRLSSFYEGVRAEFGARAVPVDVEIAQRAGRLRADAANAGRILHFADALMAATSISQGATLVTRNVRDFVGLGIDVANPFAEAG